MQNFLSRIVKYNIYVLVFLIPLFFLPFSFEAFEYSKQYLLFFLVSSAFLAWIAKQVFYDKEVRFRKFPIDYFVLGFLFIAILSVIFSVDKNSSIFGFYGRFSNGLIGLLSFGILYFLITNNVAVKSETNPKSEIQISKLLNLFLGSAGVAVSISYLSVLGIWAKIGNFLPLPQVMLQRTFNPVAGSLEGLSIFLAAAAVLLVGLIITRAAGGLLFKGLLLAASLVLMLIVGFKAAWFVLLFSLVLLVGASLAKRMFRENVNQLLIPISLIIIAAAVIVFQPVKMNLPKEQVLSSPISWQVALKSATSDIKSGFLGSGWGTFHYDFAKYKPQNFNQNWMWQIRFDRAGSHLAELLGTSGFLGLLSYLGLAGLVLIISWFLISKQFIGLPLTMAFAALLMGNVLYYQNTSLSFAFWFILGLLAVSWQTKSGVSMREKVVSFKNFPELSLLFLTLVIILGTAILSLYFYGAKYYLADVNYQKALYSLGEPRIKGLEKAVNLNSRFSQYRDGLARAYLGEVLGETQKPLADRDSAKIQSMVSASIDQARAATLLQPNWAANWETLGIIYREIQVVAAGSSEWGIKSFEKAIELEPTNPALYAEIGKLYLASGDKEKAKENFNKSVEEKSDYATALIQLALLLEQENITDQAIVKLEVLVQGNPFNVEALFQLGRLYFNNKRTDEAILLFQRIAVLAPNHSNALYSLGVAYAAQGKISSAIQVFEKVLELNPGNEDILQKLTDLKKQQ